MYLGKGGRGMGWGLILINIYYTEYYHRLRVELACISFFVTRLNGTIFIINLDFLPLGIK